jgi:DNA polymerase alpha-associated DNA helicase A
MNQTMTKLQSMPDSEMSTFIRVLFGHSSPTPVSDSDIAAIKPTWISPSLNDSQKNAIRFALASREVVLIHGPPGTGKTTTLIELILQLVALNLRLLVCGPSNISVDNIVERLAPHRVPLVRVGHPARLLPSVLDHSLDVLTQTSDAAAIVRDVRREMDQKQASVRKTRSGRERRAIYQDLRALRKEFRVRERKCVETLVRGSKVVLATLHGAGGFHLRGERFDAVLIDEASQALEAQCWVPLLSAKKVVLAGDHLQLPPTIKSSNSKDKKSKDKPALETTLFDRLLALHGEGIKRMLTVQYRMHADIASFPAAALYDAKLTNHPSVAVRLLRDLPGVEDTDDTRAPLVFWDTQGGSFPESVEDDAPAGKLAGKGLPMGESKSNEGEAAVVRAHVRALIGAGVPPGEIAVITPYNAQLAVLARLMREREEFRGVELGSVDGFQGREKEAVVVSLVRSGGEVGFLAEKRRLNGTLFQHRSGGWLLTRAVSMTRPKRHLCAVGDSETLAK